MKNQVRLSGSQALGALVCVCRADGPAREVLMDEHDWVDITPTYGITSAASALDSSVRHIASCAAAIQWPRPSASRA